MAYSEFTLNDLTNRFGLELDTHRDLFGHIPAVAVDPVLRTMIDRHHPIAITTNTEKSRAELLIAPVLVEVLRLTGNRISYYSGAEFNVDRESRLTGEADFLFTRGEIQRRAGDVLVRQPHALGDQRHDFLRAGWVTVFLRQMEWKAKQLPKKNLVALRTPIGRRMEKKILGKFRSDYGGKETQ